MGKTLAEKIISAHCDKIVTADEFVVARVDAAMASDTTAPMAIRSFESMGAQRVWDPGCCVFVIDHAAPAPNERIANLHTMMRKFARNQGCILFEAGEGICHQLMLEKGFAQPGALIVGADSHSCSYGAVGAMGIGVGSTDLSAVLLTGKIWLKVPQSIQIIVNGVLNPGVCSKDIALHSLTRLGIAGATYNAIEFCGSAVERLSLSERITLANMTIEAGAKTGFVHPIGLPIAKDVKMSLPDPDAVYAKTLYVDGKSIPPMVSLPHSPDKAVSVTEAAGIRIDIAFLGTCVNGRLEDLHAAARILCGTRVHPQTRFVVGPASRQVFIEATRDGTVEALTSAGATFIPPGCGPCVGTHNGIPGNGERVISSGNRNFKGRMGNPFAQVYLASPETVAASARAGCITDPRIFT